jgi:hypothetical protein
LAAPKPVAQTYPTGVNSLSSGNQLRQTRAPPPLATGWSLSRPSTCEPAGDEGGGLLHAREEQRSVEINDLHRASRTTEPPGAFLQV